MATVLGGPTRTIAADVSVKIADKVDAAAASMQRPREEIVEEALADWLYTEDWKHEATLQGLADVAAGRVVPHEQVRAWIESLGTDHPLPRPRSAPKA